MYGLTVIEVMTLYIEHLSNIDEIFKFKTPCESLKEVFASFFLLLISVHTYPIISFEEC